MITLYFGNPGCGKTTLACKLARKARKHYDHVYTAFDSRISGVASCSLVGLGDCFALGFPSGVSFLGESQLHERAVDAVADVCDFGIFLLSHNLVSVLPVNLAIKFMGNKVHNDAHKNNLWALYRFHFP